MIVKPSIQLRFQSSHEIAPYTKQFVFVTDSPVNFIAGQFVTLHIPHNTDSQNSFVRRSYSLANAPKEENTTFEIVISYVPGGVASEFFFNTMIKGQKIDANGPFGRLVLQNTVNKHYLFIATGTGVAPYRAMLPQLNSLMQENSEFKVTLLFGVRHVQDVLYREEFLQFSQKNSQFDFQIYYSREVSCNLSHENIGRVTEGLKKIHIQDPENIITYICGNPNMIDDVFNLLTTQLHFPKANIRIEKYTRTKTPTLKERVTS